MINEYQKYPTDKKRFDRNFVRWQRKRYKKFPITNTETEEDNGVDSEGDSKR